MLETHRIGLLMQLPRSLCVTQFNLIALYFFSIQKLITSDILMQSQCPLRKVSMYMNERRLGR